VRLFHSRIVGGRRSLTEYANGDCTFFDPEHRRCTIYPVRPRQCRTWPFWNSNLETPETWHEVCRDCPGAGTGEFVPLEEIERRAAEIDI
jgi:Fe-S-cluster containining protein